MEDRIWGKSEGPLSVHIWELAACPDLVT